MGMTTCKKVIYNNLYMTANLLMRNIAQHFMKLSMSCAHHYCNCKCEIAIEKYVIEITIEKYVIAYLVMQNHAILALSTSSHFTLE